MLPRDCASTPRTRASCVSDAAVLLSVAPVGVLLLDTDDLLPEYWLVDAELDEVVCVVLVAAEELVDAVVPLDDPDSVLVAFELLSEPACTQ